MKFSTSAPPTTLEELIERTRKRYWQEAKSIDTINSNLKTVIEFFGADRDIRTIDEDAVEEFVTHLEGRYQSATLNRKLAVLSRLLIHALRRGWIPAKVELPRKKESLNRVNFYGPEERASIMSSFTELGMSEYSSLFAFLCDTGLRLGEALTLKWEDCEWKLMGQARVTVWDHKGKKPGGVPATDRVREILEERYDACGSLSGPWASLTKHQTRYAWAKLRKHLGKEDEAGFVWHTCRHTFCSRLAQQGVPLKAIQDLARHQDISTTIRYTHLAPKDYEAAIGTLEE